MRHRSRPHRHARLRVRTASATSATSVPLDVPGYSSPRQPRTSTWPASRSATSSSAGSTCCPAADPCALFDHDHGVPRGAAEELPGCARRWRSPEPAVRCRRSGSACSTTMPRSAAGTVRTSLAPSGTLRDRAEARAGPAVRGTTMRGCARALEIAAAGWPARLRRIRRRQAESGAAAGSGGRGEARPAQARPPRILAGKASTGVPRVRLVRRGGPDGRVCGRRAAGAGHGDRAGAYGPSAVPDQQRRVADHGRPATVARDPGRRSRPVSCRPAGRASRLRPQVAPARARYSANALTFSDEHPRRPTPRAARLARPMRCCW